MSQLGYKFNTNTGNLQNDPSLVSTNTLVLIGPAVDGPVNTPIRVRSLDELKKLFGPAVYTVDYTDPDGEATGKYNGNALSRAFVVALSAGAEDIICVRATGTKATASTTFSSKLDVQPLYAGSIYNDVTLQISSGTGSASGYMYVDITQPKAKGGNANRITLLKTQTIGELIDAVNNLPSNRTVKINVNTYPSVLEAAISTITPATLTFSGGDNETSVRGETLYNDKTLYYTRLTTADTGTLDMLYGLKVAFHACALVDLYIDDEVVADDPTSSIYAPFTLWLHKMSKDVQPCVGFLACRPTDFTNNDYASIISYATTALLAETPGYYNTSRKWLKAGAFLADGLIDAQDQDLGGRCVVTAGAEFIWGHPESGNYRDSFHVFVAAKLISNPPEISVRNMVVDKARGWIMNVPSTIADRLAAGVGADVTNEISGAGAYLTCVPQTFDGKTLVVYDDATTAARNTYYRQLQTINLVNLIHIDLKNVFQQFIGTPNTSQLTAVMKALGTSVLEGYVASGALEGNNGTKPYSINVTSPDILSKKLGIVYVDLIVRPSNAVRAIIANLSVTKN